MPVEVITFGCRLNAYESEAIRRRAEALPDAGELYVVNTCTVTAEATRQARQAIRKIAREHPEARIVVTGCAAQVDPRSFAAMDNVALVLGNDEKMRPESWALLQKPQSGDAGGGRTLVGDIMEARESFAGVVDGAGGRVRAFMQIQNGCDHRCTFCIIPFGRGPSRSVPVSAVVAQARRLIEGGAREIVLSGVDITSYGKDLPGAPGLGTLVTTLLGELPDLPLLRLSSVDSVEVDEALLCAFAEEPRLAPHLHLSLQSGSDMILKRMKRRHLRADSVAVCERLRRLRPDIVFGADIIAGFPTETGDMFAESLSLVDECGLTFLHVFPFSPRPGTP
ncbi:MAG: tRNA (N(6)-L-threonylcarbamoyladenosine(37)-C(2))-methylthiotransferase MtaB, partial [Methylobacteriaceae bacterium]|nr:tRNA (N(6)-L-threonylcarbamoyladenosine(37)-C(2))-methylthiotransferase MtaB [Methylobacteriaceae bacterium]